MPKKAKLYGSNLKKLNVSAECIARYFLADLRPTP